MMRGLTKISASQAEVIFLMRFAGVHSYQDIASALDCSESAARTHVARARERLAKLLAHLRAGPGTDSF